MVIEVETVENHCHYVIVINFAITHSEMNKFHSVTYFDKKFFL